MTIQTLEWTNNKLKLIDQTELPNHLVYVECDTIEDVWDAIKKLKVRGAPAIGVAGAYGAYLGVANKDYLDQEAFLDDLQGLVEYLKACRPTAVNLQWALDRVWKLAKANCEQDIPIIKEKILNEAHLIHREDEQLCHRIGEYGQELLKDGDVVLTHCNAGALATGGRGTALAVIYHAQDHGKTLKVYADETRPLLQGARLTTWELMKHGVDVTLICDNMSGHVMRDKGVSCIIVGADRITAHGDVANKIGTYNLAVLAKEHGIPFYVAAPFSTFDLQLKSGKDIPIEERHPEEVEEGFGKRTAPQGVKVYNPAFDVTPAELVTAIITDQGILRAPYERSIEECLANLHEPNRI